MCVPMCADMTGIIPLDDDDQPTYDDIDHPVPLSPEPVDNDDDDIYEELPGQPFDPWI